MNPECELGIFLYYKLEWSYKQLFDLGLMFSSFARLRTKEVKQMVKHLICN